MNDNEQNENCEIKAAIASGKLKLRPLEEALSECCREYRVRLRCYDRWITDGKIDAVDARDRMERLASAIQYMREVV